VIDSCKQTNKKRILTNTTTTSTVKDRTDINKTHDKNHQSAKNHHHFAAVKVRLRAQKKKERKKNEQTNKHDSQ